MSKYKRLKEIITPVDTSLTPEKTMAEIRKRRRKVQQIASQIRVEAETKKRLVERARVRGLI